MSSLVGWQHHIAMLACSVMHTTEEKALIVGTGQWGIISTGENLPQDHVYHIKYCHTYTPESCNPIKGTSLLEAGGYKVRWCYSEGIWNISTLAGLLESLKQARLCQSHLPEGPTLLWSECFCLHLSNSC
jgi:hypothetical protein